MKGKANITDLYSFSFSKLDLSKEYMVDTNVLFKVYYSKSSAEDIYNKTYSKLIEFLLNHDVTLRTTTYNIAELLYLIEKVEYDCYLKISKKTQNELSLKEFRKISEERAKIQTESDLILMQITSMFEVDEICTKIEVLQSFVENYEYIPCDNYDYSIIQYYKSQGKLNFISHDIDFAHIPSINLYTMNPKINEK